jgi:hypothetical protein
MSFAVTFTPLVGAVIVVFIDAANVGRAIIVVGVDADAPLVGVPLGADALL